MPIEVYLNFKRFGRTFWWVAVEPSEQRVGPRGGLKMENLKQERMQNAAVASGNSA